jgi:sulfur-carrier protein adenylyltransferase/sulfurtransferase
VSARITPSSGWKGLERTEVAGCCSHSAKIRLTIPEAYEVHRSIIEWNARYSETKIPDQAVGLDPVGLALMRWAMKSWPRTRLLSVYLGGTLLPRLQLDLLPGLGCAAHVMMLAPRPAAGVDDHVRAGAAVQRLWLTATKLGLQHQPEMTPLIFSGYHRSSVPFTQRAGGARRCWPASTSGCAASSRRTAWIARFGWDAWGMPAHPSPAHCGGHWRI